MGKLSRVMGGLSSSIVGTKSQLVAEYITSVGSREWETWLGQQHSPVWETGNGEVCCVCGLQPKLYVIKCFSKLSGLVHCPR